MRHEQFLNSLALGLGKRDEQQFHRQYPDKHDASLRHNQLSHYFGLFFGL